MIVVGLCGSSGSGKGYVGKKFEKYGVVSIDTDKVYRDICLLLPSCVNELTDYFGMGILKNGFVDRSALATIVFEGKNAKEDLKCLNEITHKYIKAETEKLIGMYAKEGYKAVLVDAPVLFESGFDKICHVTVCVTAPTDEKIERIIKRDEITEEKAIARISKQLSDENLKSRCTYTIDNSNGSNIDSQIISILKDLGIETDKP